MNGLNPYLRHGQAQAQAPQFQGHGVAQASSQGQVFIDARTGDHVIDSLRLGQGRSLAFDQHGEINASSQADLLQNINQIMLASSQGQVRRNAQITAAERRERLQVFTAAHDDPTGEAWVSLGASIAEAIRQQGDREGFLRRLANGQPLEQGQMPRVPMPSHDAVAVVATSAAAVEYQVIRNRVFTPPEFSITANLRCENIELQQVSGDLLEVMYNQGLEAIMVREDLLWKQSADATINMDNPLQLISGGLTPDILSTLRNGVTQWNLPATTVLLANDYWNDIIGNPAFHTFLEPVTKYDLVLNGSIGTILGMEIITDAFRQPNQKVLNKGDIYVVGSPENHGSYTDRGGIVTTPTNGAVNGTSTKGFFLEEFFSFVLANPRSVSVGRRL